MMEKGEAVWNCGGVLKDRAKRALAGQYWQAFLVSLIIIITGGGFLGSGGRSAGKDADFGSVDPAVMVLIVLGVLTLAGAFFFFRLLVGTVVEVGGRRYFTDLAGREAHLGYIGYGFRRNRYGTIVLTMFLRGLFIFLWALLLVIPGIVKAYSYRMVPYLLGENPRMGWRRALELSGEMTDGEKWDIFVLDLSFIGWYILGMMALGVGVLFVQPYYDAVQGELYKDLREQALEEGLTDGTELGGIHP